MKTTRILTGLLGILLASNVWAQTTQTVRGTVVDEVSKTPLVSVNVSLVGSDPILGSATDLDGNYRIEKVPVGRQTFKISYIGYEDQSIPNVVVTAGKEVILNISLIESIQQLNAVVVVANTREDKTATNNDLAIVSARSFNLDDTKRYAGALGDPSRMAANFAGVIGGDDSRNDIVVRGNSPTGMLWQLEGLNIPNPNHFGSLNSTGGPVSMLNNNNLDKSDFMTSAFPAQYGNAVAGVFDIRLRDGNNQKSEFVSQIGFNGFEAGAEGPLSKNGKGSYIANYRYSTLGVFNALGIEFGTGANIPLYQDLNFKVTLPTKGNGKWSVFGLGGISSIDLLGSEADLESSTDLYGSENQDGFPRYKTGIAGVSFEKNLTKKTFMKLTAGISATDETFTGDSLVRDGSDEVVARYRQSEAAFTTTKASLVGLFRTKFNSKNSISYGFNADVLNFDFYNRDFFANSGTDSVRINVEDVTSLYQGFATWRHRFNNKLSFNAGVHTQYYALNEQAVIEPRLGIQYMISGDQSLSFGYGIHNQTQSPYTSYVQTKLSDNQYTLTNTDLKFTTSQHSVITYDWNISDNLRLKAEGYYQVLSNVPVEQRVSSFSAINTGSSFIPVNQDSLVNTGTGTNYGIEITLERFFSKGFYFLITSSVFQSSYEGSDKIERNTAYNTQYVANGLFGKEFSLGSKQKYLSINLKVTTIGGKYLTPIDFEASQQNGRTIYKENEAYTEKQDPYFRTDLRIAYRKEYKKSTLEIALDLQNVTNNQNIFSQSYNPRTNAIVTQYQQGFFPVPFVRYTF
ncbi:MAG: TonB-dependent receptor [Cyclobacteriaceae bacterium]|nr:TonB-dependent receptor [Cyclobacteriaceae bacterium]